MYTQSTFERLGIYPGETVVFSSYGLSLECKVIDGDLIEVEGRRVHARAFAKEKCEEFHREKGTPYRVTNPGILRHYKYNDQWLEQISKDFSEK